MNKRIRKKRSWYGYPGWCVRKVVPRDDFTILLYFRNGERKVFDLKPFLDDIAAPLKEDRELYMKPIVEGGTVHWGENFEIAIAPEYIYENSQPIPPKETA